MREQREAPVAAGAAALQNGGGTSSGTTVEGYAAVYFDARDPRGTSFELDSITQERISPGAFDAALRERHDVRLLLNHNPDFILARTASGTLTLTTDSRGLKYRATLDPANPSAASVLSALRRGDLSTSSFGFRVLRERYDRGDGKRIRWLESVALSDVSICAYSAYTSTPVSIARSAADLRRHRARLWRLVSETQAPDVLEHLHSLVEENEVAIARALVAERC